jgi:hypothetical protein
MAAVTVESQPDVLVAVSIIVPEEPDPHVTEMAVPEFVVIVPPFTVQL